VIALLHRSAMELPFSILFWSVVTSFISLKGSVTLPDEEKQWYELVKHNFLTLDPATTEVLRTVQGLGFAQHMAELLTGQLSPEEREAGFAVYQRKGRRPPGSRRVRRPPTKRASRR